MNEFNNTADNVLKNRTTNVWGAGKNYDAKTDRRLSPKRKISIPVNTGHNTQPYMASSPSYLPNMAARSDKSIRDDFKVNYGVQIPHAYMEKPYVGFSDPNYKFMKNRKPSGGPAGTEPNPLEATGDTEPLIWPEEPSDWISDWLPPIFDKDYWQPEEVEVVSGGWVQHFDNNNWYGVSEIGISWNESEQRWETSDNARLFAIGTWATDYRPTIFRMTFSGVADINILYLQDTENNSIFYQYNYTSGTELACTFLSYNLEELFITEGAGVLITNIEFYEPEITYIIWEPGDRWTWPASSGAIKVHDQSNWAKDFQPKKIKFTAIGDGNTQTVYLRDKNSNNIMIEDITPPNGVATEYIFKLDWHKADDIDSFGFTTSNTVSITEIEFFSALMPPSQERAYRYKKRERKGKIQPTPYLV